MNYPILISMAVCAVFLTQWFQIVKNTTPVLQASFSDARRKISFDAFYAAYKWAFIMMLIFSGIQIFLFAYALFQLFQHFMHEPTGYIFGIGIMLLYARARLFYSTCYFVLVRSS